MASVELDTLPTEAGLQDWHTSRGLSPVYDADVHLVPEEPGSTIEAAAAAAAAAPAKSKRRPAAETPGEVVRPALNDAGDDAGTEPDAGE